MSKIKLKNPPMKVIPNNSRISWHGYVADKGGCGHLRVIIPYILTNIHRFKNSNIQIYTSYGMNYSMDENFYKGKLFVLFQRAATFEQLKIIKFLKKNIFNKTKTAIIYEVDDDFTEGSIPEWNMAADYFNKNRKYCLNIIENAYAVSTSTEYLAKKLRKYNKRVIVNQNHLPKFIWGSDIPEIKEIKNKKPRIYWGGSSNHFALPNSDKNGGDFGNKLIDFIKKTTDIYDWVFIGAIPKEIIEIRDKIELHEWQSVLYYPHYIKSLNIDIGIAPLAKHEFNKSKSNIKAQEYTAAGIPAIYTNIIPYENMKLICDSDEEMISNIEMLVSDSNKRKEVWEHDYSVLKEDLFWEENNNIEKYINNYLNMFNMRLPED